MKATIPEFVTVLAALKGRKGLRTGKPKSNGFDQYVWRMARFHSGIDMSIPIVCDWVLEEWYEQFEARPKAQDYATSEDWYTPFKEWNGRVREVRKIADDYADRVLIELGYDPMKAARRWHRAFYG